MHQGCRAVASGWMHYDAWGFHENNEILVLMQRDKIEGFGNQSGRRFRGDYERNVVPGLERILGLLNKPVHHNHSCPDKLLYA